MSNYYLIGTKYTDPNNDGSLDSKDIVPYCLQKNVIAIGFAWNTDLTNYYNRNPEGLEILLKGLPIVGSLFNSYRADNISGVEKDGIITTAMGNMFTVSKSDVSSFTVKYGATSTSSSNSSRQYSLYMKGFQYPNQIMLPLKLISFTATIDNNNKEYNLECN